MKETKAMNEWSCAGWSEHAVLRRDIARGMSFAERLRWLEGATGSARLLRAAPVVAPPAYALRAVVSSGAVKAK